MTASDLQQAIAQAGVQTAPLGRIAVWSRCDVQLPSDPVAQFEWQRMPFSAEAAAHHLFAQLRDFDAQAATQIWVELPPPAPEWDGVRDRLIRAATPTR
jgi:L-threonylcarbamoyladenylate synthase